MCLIPYLKTDYTENVYPTKLNEYLYWRKPVVATDLAEIKQFENEFPGLIHIASDAAQFYRMVESAVESPGDETVQERRRETARINSWENKLEEMGTCMEEMIRQKEMELETNWVNYFRHHYSRLKSKGFKLILTGLAILYLLFFTPLIWYLAEPLKIEDNPHQADAILVLAGGVGESGEAGQGYEERVHQAVRLYQAGYARHLVFSSGYMYLFKEPLVMKSLALSMGIPDSDIILEDKATNTLENIVNCKAILSEKGWENVILISSPYHMLRVQRVIHKQAPDWQVIFIPPRHNRFYSHSTSWLPLFSSKIRMHQIRGIVHEYASILYYWWRGWI